MMCVYFFRQKLFCYICIVKSLIFIILSLFCLLPITWSQEVWLQPNEGQWDAPILYRVSLNQGNFFIEKNRFTFALNNHGSLYEKGHHQQSTKTIEKFHTIRSVFLNSSWQGKLIKSDSSSFYRNYFIGNDKSKWVSKIYSYKKIEMVDFYPGINLIVQTFPTHIKYSFKVKPHVNPSIIKIQFEGTKNLSLDKNKLTIPTRFGPIIQNGVSVYTKKGESKNEVATNLKLHDNILSFQFPNAYDTTKTLIIDPNLVFSTFTGSTADNWGFTATPANNGDLIAGGIVFGVGYPITTGAYDNTYNNGVTGGIINGFLIDLGISKFSSDGSQLLYSTLIGGTGNETPNSIIVDAQDNLYILGISSSTDYPTTSDAFQQNNNGGHSKIFDAINFNGTDIVISALSSDGTQLLASTYIGGSNNDGLNDSQLAFNYGDVFRGDINFDNTGNVVFVSSTQSSDFPIINGFDNTLGGNLDAVLVKLSPDLKNVIWSTYFGGSDDDAGYSIAIDDNDIFIVGGTKSTDLASTNGVQTTYQGGFSDGFITKINNTSSALINTTYVGTPHYDQTYFIDIDQAQNIYIFGQSNGNMPISSNVYSNPNSGQFIQQYSNNLNLLNWSTVIGGGNGVIEISPTAFMVSNCNEIYYTGWGGIVNIQNSSATMSTTNNFPTTPDAYQQTTNGSNFYIGVLSDDAQNLVYGSFMGGMQSSYNHVDGGTSRFDKDGSIYHAVCGACGGDDHGFTTTPGAYSETNNSSNCNMAAWKFNLSKIHSAASIPEPFICLPDSAFFNNNSQNGNMFYWDFGDGVTSIAYEPHHFYAQPGTYHASLIVSDSDNCVIPDTAYMTIIISEFNGAVTIPPNSICPGEPIQLEASGGTNYQWSPAAFLDNPNSATPLATIYETTTFSVIVSDSCGIDTLTVTVEVNDISFTTSGNIKICKEDTITLWAQGGIQYNWTSSEPNSIISSQNKDSIQITPNGTSIYIVNIHKSNGCDIIDTIYVSVIDHVPFPVIDDTIAVCEGESKRVTVGSHPMAPLITWNPAGLATPSNGPSVVLSSPISQWYIISFTNVCGTVVDSLYFDVITISPTAGNDTIVCPLMPVDLWAKGGTLFEWFPAASITSPKKSQTTAIPPHPITYTVKVSDENGCFAYDSVKILWYPKPFVIINGSNFYGITGDEVLLSAKGNGNNGVYFWSPSDGLSCTHCAQPIATPSHSITYKVSYEDENGCIAKASTNINFDPLIYVPNTFTPDGKGVNNIFKAVAANIDDFHLIIYNRWGEIIFESYNKNIGWDGTYGGKICQDGTYIWAIKYKDSEKREHTLTGHVNLIR